MKLIVFGATGTTGKQVVIQGLALGYEVTAFVRDRAKLRDIQHSSLTTIEGNVFNAEEVAAAVKGHDAVLCTLGDGRKGIVRAAGTNNIIRAMQQHHVMRLICMSTLGAGDSKGNLNFIWKYIMFGWLLKKAFLDHEQQEKYVMASKLDWTIVRPGALTKGGPTGHFQHGFSENVSNLKLKISQGDVAAFMLQQLSSDQYLHKTPGLSY